MLKYLGKVPVLTEVKLGVERCAEVLTKVKLGVDRCAEVLTTVKLGEELSKPEDSLKDP